MLLPRPQAQCTNHMHLPTALELVYEMRQRNVSPNTHTYSSMLNVCVKAGELDLALDVFNQVGLVWGWAGGWGQQQLLLLCVIVCAQHTASCGSKSLDRGLPLTLCLLAGCWCARCCLGCHVALVHTVA